ncbi:MAG: radical SAM protein [Candidatus Hydrothermarchaeales archaeon]
MHPKLINCALKNQEALYLYNFRTDERYELDEESFEFLRRCTGKGSIEEILETASSDENEARVLLDYLSLEGCIENGKDVDAPEAFSIQDPVLPSLRYLQLHITERCNLNCAHCYLGEKEQKDLDFKLIKKVLEEFSPNGMKVLITGGEPLLHKRFWEVLERASTFPVRLELLTNGTLITKEVAERLSKYIHAMQISLDGMKDGHEYLRGKDTFKKAVRGIKNAAKVLDVNVATMVHSGNLSEFEEMKEFVEAIGAREWNLDIPSLAGNAVEDILPPYPAAAEIFRRYGFGAGVHEGDQGYSCGSHICTVDVNGGVSKCGFFDEGVGNIKDENLMMLWERVVERYTPPVKALECWSCAVVNECRGGCRYRAKVSGDFLGKDPFMCTMHLG